MSGCRCLEHGGLTQSAEVIFNTIAEIGPMKLDDRGVVVLDTTGCRFKQARARCDRNLVA
jgi:hypothetical protein